MCTCHNPPLFCHHDADSHVLRSFQDNQVMIRIFNGIRPAVVALIVIPCISAARALKLKYWQLVLPAIATILIWQFGLSPVYIVLAGIAGGMLYTLWLKDKLRKLQI